MGWISVMARALPQLRAMNIHEIGQEKGCNYATKVGNYDRSRTTFNFEIVAGKVVPVNKNLSIPERIK
jgi:hypothetical protein